MSTSSNNTFVHCIIKLAVKFHGKILNSSSLHDPHTSCYLTFSLLKNLAMTSECRGIMLKVCKTPHICHKCQFLSIPQNLIFSKQYLQSNFLVEFPRLSCLSHQKSKSGQKTLIVLWLQLLTNITFFRDGQQMVTRIKNVIPLLLEYCGNNNSKISGNALSLLRNLCFHIPCKSLLLSNSMFLIFIIVQESHRS